MQKIPNLFQRDPDNPDRVTTEVTPGCRWVLNGEGTAGQMYDGVCVLYDGRRWWARTKVKTAATPDNFVEVDFEATPDTAAGSLIGWVPIEQTPYLEAWAEAVEPLIQFGGLIHRKHPTGTFELVGPSINGNPEKAQQHRLESHANPTVWSDVPTDVDGIREFVQALLEHEGWEGLVWTHPDGRRAKLRGREVQ